MRDTTWEIVIKLSREHIKMKYSGGFLHYFFVVIISSMTQEPKSQSQTMQSINKIKGRLQQEYQTKHWNLL